MPQAETGKQETSSPFGYPRNSTGSHPGGVIGLSGVLARASVPEEPPEGRTSAELLLKVSQNLPGNCLQRSCQTP